MSKQAQDEALAALLGQRIAARRGGPKTALGKQTSSGNALTHGLTSNAPTIPGETVEAWESHRAAIVASLDPVGALETALAERAALLLWRLNRVWRAEVALVTRQIDKRMKFDLDGMMGTPCDPAEASVPYAAEDHVSRYEVHISRLLWATLNHLEACQRRRQGDAQPLARLEVNAPALEK